MVPSVNVLKHWLMIADDRMDLESIPSSPNVSFNFVVFSEAGRSQIDDLMIGSK